MHVNKKKQKIRFDHFDNYKHHFAYYYTAFASVPNISYRVVNFHIISKDYTSSNRKLKMSKRVEKDRVWSEREREREYFTKYQ